jgi:geranylgeranyl transferase type-2 subunit beta
LLRFDKTEKTTTTTMGDDHEVISNDEVPGSRNTDGNVIDISSTNPSSMNVVCDELILLDDDVDAPPFYRTLHIKYITGLSVKLDAPTSYEGAVTEHLRISGVYWSLTALYLLIPYDDDINERMKLTSDIVNWVFTCYDPMTGGFGGNTGQEGHLLYTLSAIQVLALADCLKDDRLRTIQPSIIQFVSQLQKPDGSFAGDQWGEIDTRFTYCALSTLSLLGVLNQENENNNSTGSSSNAVVDGDVSVNVRLAAEYIISCRNLDGGFGSIIGAESHAGQVFCCVGALSIANSLDLLLNCDTCCDLLSWWLCERQCDSGGLNGRPEKQADVCYSWWILSSLSILGRVPWINKKSLARFILNCQDNIDGGIADRPNDMPDVFHTFFGIAGLSLLGYLHNNNNANNEVFRKIDPIYALPTTLVQTLKLPGQVIVSNDDDVDTRLSHYDALKV